MGLMATNTSFITWSDGRLNNSKQNLTKIFCSTCIAVRGYDSVGGPPLKVAKADDQPQSRDEVII